LNSVSCLVLMVFLLGGGECYLGTVVFFLVRFYFFICCACILGMLGCTETSGVVFLN